MHTCPNCQSNDMYGIQYAPTSPNRYQDDMGGISEYSCGNCGARYGRWTRQRLADLIEEPVWGGKETDPELEDIPAPEAANGDTL